MGNPTARSFVANEVTPAAASFSASVFENEFTVAASSGDQDNAAICAGENTSDCVRINSTDIVQTTTSFLIINCKSLF